ncbi:hypothetical protein ACJX0J_026538 [Zea mays]
MEVIVFAFSLVQENQLAKKETYEGVEKNELNKVESYHILLFLSIKYMIMNYMLELENVQYVNHLIYSSTKFKATEKQFYFFICFIYPQITSIIDIVQQNGY